ncbi:MAG: exo-alpha-sialidase [Opitutaceae bacterium]
MPLDLHFEARRTAPDYFTYLPDASAGLTVAHASNEHFLVDRLPDGRLFAVWTQSSFEGNPDQHIVFATSADDGKTWSAPVTIAGADVAKGLAMASWAFPLVSRGGRLYVIFSRHAGVNDIFTHTTGLMACIHSDDCGKTWSEQTILPMPRGKWDNPDPGIPANWIVWQKPIRIADGRYFTGFTRWVSPAVRPAKPIPKWWAEAAVVEFMRFENVDENPDPADLRITWLMSNEQALQTGLVGHPRVPCIQEPSLIVLPDGRLFCVMRTTLGSPYYSVGSADGSEWRTPEPLRQFDDGPVLPHPLSPCPIYEMEGSGYAFFYHGHNGYFLDKTPSDTSDHRRPVCLARGEFRPTARQPVWFSAPWFFMDNGGVSILRSDLALYASVTQSAEGIVLWYPERKFFLLGKKIDRRHFTGLTVKTDA